MSLNIVVKPRCRYALLYSLRCNLVASYDCLDCQIYVFIGQKRRLGKNNSWLAIQTRSEVAEAKQGFRAFDAQCDLRRANAGDPLGSIDFRDCRAAASA